MLTDFSTASSPQSPLRETFAEKVYIFGLLAEKKNQGNKKPAIASGFYCN